MCVSLSPDRDRRSFGEAHLSVPEFEPRRANKLLLLRPVSRMTGYILSVASNEFVYKERDISDEMGDVNVGNSDQRGNARQERSAVDPGDSQGPKQSLPTGLDQSR